MPCCCWQVAVNDLCLGVHQAERFGLLGPNGAGVITSSCQNTLIVFALFPWRVYLTTLWCPRSPPTCCRACAMQSSF